MHLRRLAGGLRGFRHCSVNRVSDLRVARAMQRPDACFGLANVNLRRLGIWRGFSDAMAHLACEWGDGSMT